MISANNKLLIGASLMCLSLTAYAAGTGITVAGIEVDLGAEQGTVLDEFRTYNLHLQCMDGEGASVESCKSVMVSSAGTPAMPYANMIFEDYRLAKVYKYWDQSFSENDVRGFVNALYGVLRNTTGDEPVRVTLGTREQIEPGIALKEILITSGRKTVNISVNSGSVGPHGDNQYWVNLHEELE